MLVKRTTKNQITLPKEVVNKFPSVEYFEIRVEGEKIVLTPVKTIPSNITLEKIRKKIKGLKLNEEDVKEAVRWARKD